MAFIRLGKNKKKIMLKQVQQNNEDVKQNKNKKNHWKIPSSKSK